MYKTTSSQKQNYSVQVESNHKYLQIEEEEEEEGDTTNEMGKCRKGREWKQKQMFAAGSGNTHSKRRGEITTNARI